MDDAIAAVRKCLKNIIGGDADHLKMTTNINNTFPGDTDRAGIRSLLTCLKRSTEVDLDAGDFSEGTFQDIADKLAGVGE
jgi:hypothetical protein